MIVISDCCKDIVIPAGLGDNAGVIYDVAGVKSLNGQTGDVTLKTVNGNELTGDGNIEIKAGVESVNGKTGAVVIPALQYFEVSQETKKEAYDEIANHWDDNSGYTGDRIFCYKKPNGGVYTFTEIGYLKDHSVYFSWLNNEGAYSVGDGKVKCFAIIIWYNAGDPSMDIYEQHCTIPTKVSELTNDSGFQTKAEVDTAIENAVSGGSTGSDDVIVLDNLTQEERKAIHDKLDLTKPLVKPFMYEGKISVCAWDSGGGNVKFLTFGNNYDGIQVKRYNFAPDGWLGEDNRGHTYTNSVLFSLGTHVEESGYFDADYIGNFYDYVVRPYTRPNAAFINLAKGIGDSTQPIYAPVSFSVPEDEKNVRIQFIANEKLYTFIIDAEQENRWHFESAEPITGGGATNALTYKQITNENRQEVYDDVKAHWSDVSGYTGNYVYFYQKDKDQIIFDEVKFEDNNVYFNSATVTFTSGQVHNPGVRLLCSIVPSEGNVQINEKYTTISSIDGMQYRARGEVNGNAAIFFDTNSYGNGYGIYSTVDTGEENGLFGARFRDGIDGYKGNTPANIFTDGTDVFMAFDVVDFHYVYKVQTDGTWAFVSKTKIGGVQSSEVSNIKVLTQTEYDGLTAKDENVLYCIKG